MTQHERTATHATKTALVQAERRAVRDFRTPVRGSSFAARPPGADDVAPGRRARLVREPDNPADGLAVAVWVTDDDAGQWRLGYLDRAVAARIAPMLDRGERFDVEVEDLVDEPSGRWRRPLVALRAVEAPDSARQQRRLATRHVPHEPVLAAELPPQGAWTTRLVDRPPGTRRRVISTPG